MKKFISLLLVAMLLVPSAAFAEGFALYEWSAGGAAMAENYMFAENDPSVLAYNPAQITKLRGSYFQAGFSFINPHIGLDYYKNGNNIGCGGTNYNPATVPSLYYVQDSKDSNFWWGVGIFARYGNAMDLNRGGLGRYDTIFAGVTSITVQPTVAFKPHKKWSVAFGLDLNYAALKQKKAIDGTQGANPGAGDIFTRLEGESFNVGYILSAMYDFNEKTSISAVYRSRIRHSMKDADMDVQGTGGATAQTKCLKADGVVTLPDSITLGVNHKFSEKTRAEFDVVWTNWTTYDKLNLCFNGPVVTGMPATANESIINDWKAAWKIGAGIEHKLNKKWTVMCGYTWDQSPVPNEHCNLNLPTGNRHYMSVGLKFSPNDVMTWTLGYCYIIMGDRLITANTAKNPAFDYVKANGSTAHNIALSLTVKCR